MAKVTMIKMQGCPYCAAALRAVQKLKAEDKYKGVEVEEIDENNDAASLSPYNGKYYYVPTLFVAGEKLYEAHPGDDDEKILGEVQNAFDRAIG